MLTRTPYCIPSSLGVRWRLVSPAHVSCRCPARTISRSKLIRQHRAFWRRSGYSRAPSYNCGSQLLAHRVILQQCSASVAFGAKRILSPAHRAVLGSARSRGFALPPAPPTGLPASPGADRRPVRSDAVRGALRPARGFKRAGVDERRGPGGVRCRGAVRGVVRGHAGPRGTARMSGHAGTHEEPFAGANHRHESGHCQPWKSVKNSLYANKFGAITLACTGPYFRVKPSS